MGPILAVFFVSGAASLVYEVVWMRQLTLIFGVSTYATSAILATYMGGLALGSFLFGRRADAFRRPLRAYAALEIAIGLYALALPLLFEALRTPYIALFRLDLPYTTLALARALLAAAVLLPPTVLMGGTLPVLAALFVRLRGDVGRQTGLLYFVNTGGAVAGCVLTGFYLIEHFGMLASTHLAAATNFALALGAFLLDRRQPERPRRPSEADVGSSVAAPALVARGVLLAISVSGFTALAYEVFWTRALLRYVYNSTYAFTTMLAVFLAGLTLGSWLLTVLPLRRSRPLWLFAGLELGVGLGFLASLLLFVDLRGASAFFLGDVIGSFGDSIQTFALRSALILFVPTVFLGATLPLATQIVARHSAAIGHSVGRVYGINTLGAIAGSLAVSFVLIPRLGMEDTLMLLVSLNVLIAAGLAVLAADGASGRLAAGATGGVLVAAIAFAMPGDVFRRTFAGTRGGEIVFYREGATDTVGVVEKDGQRRILYEDRRGTAATWSYPWGYVFGHLPLLLHPGRPERALHICFGVGNSLSATAAHDSIQTIDNVELSPHVLEAADYFWTNDGILESPKVQTVIEDGRNFAMATDRVYDVVALEPPETFTAGVINLYTREFYELVAERLADDGILAQWIPVGEGTLDEEKMLFRAFVDVFPQATAWQQLTRDGNVVLIGSKRPLRIDYALLEAKMAEPRVRRDLELSQVRDPIDVLSMFLFGPADLARFVRGVPPVVDDRTVLDFRIPRRLGSGFGTGFFVTDVQSDGKLPLSVIRERALSYHRTRRSVMPHLTNLGGRDAAELDRLIRQRERPTNRQVMVPIPESEWRRWP